MTTPLPASAPAIDVPASAAPAGRVAVGQYELLLELASGGMAVVYLGRAIDGRDVAPLVAIKRPHRHLATDKNFLAMLLDEARLASAITHENVVKVRELHFHEGEPFIVMDYVEGASLSELRKELAASERAFDVRVALHIILDALAGLHAAHELCDASGKPLGIVHRDVSPHNILVGGDGRARLTDFGIAQAADRVQVTKTQEVKGKLAYLAPERIDRRRICTRQSDLFSMGIVLWECLAGRRLFRGDQAIDTLQEVMLAPIPRLRQIGLEISPDLDDVLARALSRDLAVRFSTAAEFAGALRSAAGPIALGGPDGVAGLVLALYGRRMGERHDKVRAALGDDAVADRLFEGAGFIRPGRGSHAEATSTIDAIRALAPPAPSERYLFGAIASEAPRIERRHVRWAVSAGVAAGLVAGAGVALLVATRAPAPAPIATSPAPVVPVTPTPSAGAAPAPTTRHLVISLPELASRVALDGVERDLTPPADVAAFDLPLDAGITHHVIVTSTNGTRTQATVREEEGVGRVTGDGFSLMPRSPSASTGTPPPPPLSPRRPGVVRNGFTKLK